RRAAVPLSDALPASHHGHCVLRSHQHRHVKHNSVSCTSE
ncbi:hypothetical protein AK812_SmicGene47171, partial [Symbiodinium microadriaticum]